MAAAARLSSSVSSKTVKPPVRSYPYELENGRVRPGHWKQISNHRTFFSWLESELGVTKFEDWYHVNSHEIKIRGGTGLLNNYYGGSLCVALQAIYPEYKWHEWLFPSVSTGFWDSMKNQREYFKWLANKMNFTELSDWYRLRSQDVEQNSGSSLMYMYYNNSISVAVMTVFPEYEWQPWRFDKVPAGYWSDRKNIKTFLNWVGEQSGITCLEDWYNININNIPKLKSLACKQGGMISLLKKCYPGYNWAEPDRMRQHGSSKGQLILYKLVQQLFPGTTVDYNYKSARFLIPNTTREFELDVFVSSLSIAFEFQGEHHYHWHYLGGSPSETQALDKLKEEVLTQRGITLIQIPYWWDGKIQSLQATIHQFRPDAIDKPAFGQPIDLNNIPESNKRKLVPPEVKKLPWMQFNSPAYSVTIADDNRKPKCRSCTRTITEKTEPRIAIKGTFTGNDLVPHPVRFFICLKPSCLQTSVSRYSHFRSIGISFPRFEMTVGVPNSLKEKVVPLIEFQEWNKEFSGSIQWDFFDLKKQYQ